MERARRTEQAYGSDYFYAGHSILYDYPYAGQRTFDL